MAKTIKINTSPSHIDGEVVQLYVQMDKELRELKGLVSKVSKEINAIEQHLEIAKSWASRYKSVLKKTKKHSKKK